MRSGLPVTLAAVAALLVPAADADWASFHGDALNTGAAASEHHPYVDFWWSEKGGSNKQVLASPVIKDGRLIVADRGGLVRALDVQSGFEFWRYKMPASVEGTPAVSADHVYVADVKGNLKSLNLFDGRVEFEVAAGPTAGNIAEHEGKVFLGTEAGEMKAYLADLTLLWTFKAGDYFEGEKTSCTGSGTSLKCETVCVDDANLEQPFANQPIRGKPAVYAGYVYFGSLNNAVFAVQEGGRGNGKTTAKWFYKTGDVVIGAPGVVHVNNADHVVVGSYDGKVYLFPANNGGSDGVSECGDSGDFRIFKADYEHKFDVPSIVTGGSEQQVSRVYSSPANDGQRVYVGAMNGFLYALKADTMEKVWEKRIGSEITPVKSSPAVTNGIVI
ncbi:MAG: PQQ-binding-like beta-propeller repeat protein, partial [Thermoplasmatota archaeon]